MLELQLEGFSVAAGMASLTECPWKDLGAAHTGCSLWSLGQQQGITLQWWETANILYSGQDKSPFRNTISLSECVEAAKYLKYISNIMR